MTERRYYILSLEHSSDGIATWWREEGRGYTTDLKQAGVFDLAAAAKACSARSRIKGEPPPEIAIPVEWPLVVRHTVPLYGGAQGAPVLDWVSRHDDALREVLTEAGLPDLPTGKAPHPGNEGPSSLRAEWPEDLRVRQVPEARG